MKNQIIIFVIFIFFIFLPFDLYSQVNYPKIKKESKFKNGIPEYCKDFCVNGKEKFEIYYDDSGKVEKKYEHFYENSNKYKEIRCYQNKKGEVFSCETIFFFKDTTGNVIMSYTYDSLMNLKGYSVKSNDSINKINKIEIFDNFGHLIFYNENKMNEGEKIIESIYEMSLFPEHTKIKFIYDEIGNNIEKLYYNREGSLTAMEIIKFSLGIKTESQYYGYDSQNKRAKDIIKYDYIGNEIEKNVYDTYGNILETYTKKYDKFNNIIEEVYSGDGKDNPYIITYKYEFY